MDWAMGKANREKTEARNYHYNWLGLFVITFLCVFIFPFYVIFGDMFCNFLMQAPHELTAERVTALQLCKHKHSTF